MKSLRKIMALFLAMVTVLGMSVSVFATSISVNKPEGAATTHTYNVYQIFTGKVANEQLTEIQYGTSHPEYIEGGNNFVPKNVLDGIKTEDQIREYAKSLTKGAAVGQVTEGGAALTVADGYYLLEDVSYTDAKVDDAFSAIIVKVISGEVAVTPKRVKPTVDKEVKDENVEGDKEAASTDGWGETADHEIGETFQFRLTATLPANENYAQYPTYMVRFNDTMSAGVSFESIASVSVDDVTIPATGYTCTATENQAGGAWTLTIADLKKIAGVNLADGASVVVVYNAHLNSAATVTTADGATDNENKVSLTYSNNPDATGKGGTDTTEEDHVWVFTYGNNGTKEDANGQKLAGAGFTLYKGSVADSNVVPLYKVGNDYFVYNVEKSDAYTNGAPAEKNEMVTTDEGIFNVKGLDIGTYVLVETTVPDGYVKAEDTTFTISATHTESTDGVSNVKLGQDTKTSEKIVNYTGSTLPSTGGIGTTIFYIVGGILVAGAAIILIAKRKVEA